MFVETGIFALYLFMILLTLILINHHNIAMPEEALLQNLTQCYDFRYDNMVIRVEVNKIGNNAFPVWIVIHISLFS